MIVRYNGRGDSGTEISGLLSPGDLYRVHSLLFDGDGASVLVLNDAAIPEWLYLGSCSIVERQIPSSWGVAAVARSIDDGPGLLAGLPSQVVRIGPAGHVGDDRYYDGLVEGEASARSVLYGYVREAWTQIDAADRKYEVSARFWDVFAARWHQRKVRVESGLAIDDWTPPGGQPLEEYLWRWPLAEPLRFEPAE